MTKSDYQLVCDKLSVGPMSSTTPGTEKEDRIAWEMTKYGIPESYKGGGKIYHNQKFLLFDKNGGFIGYYIASTDKAESANSYRKCKLSDIDIDIS